MHSTASRKGSRRVWLVPSLLLMGMVLLTLLVRGVVFPASETPVVRAWDIAQTYGNYQYRSTVIQTTHPTEKVINAGASSKTAHLMIEGDVDRFNEVLNLTITGYPDKRRPVQIQVKGNQAQGRVGTQDWQPLDSPEQIFNTNNDPLGFLQAIDSIASNDSGDGRVYNFTISGPRYADYVRDQLEQYMHANGSLPPSLSMSMPSHYVNMQASGTLWLNDQGLPIRQEVHLVFPANDGVLEWTEADIQTHFSGWQAWPGFSVGQLWRSPSSLAPMLGLTQTQLQHNVVGLAFMLFMLLFSMFLLRHMQSRRLYVAIVASVIIAMIIQPLLVAQQTSAYGREQATQAEQVQQAVAQPQRQFNPLQDPNEQPQSRPISSMLATTTSTTESVSSQHCTDGLDSDSDGLDNDIECYELGTNPSKADSDGDYLSDYIETVGFTASNGQKWYLDPLNMDSNSDGLTDGQECPELIDISLDGNSITASGTRCADTDSDNTPDVYDYDNDGDSAPDSVDLTSQTKLGSMTSGVNNQTFSYDVAINDTTGINALFVDLQMRPLNADHLWYTNNVLDWPTDSEGQVMRRFTDTLYDYGGGANTYDTAGKLDNGDVILSPYAEVTLTYDPSNPSAGLPVKSGYATSAITGFANLDWVDTDVLDEYGISVSQGDDIGSIAYMYSPLVTQADSVGDSPVAWNSRLVYRPTSTTWGPTHQLKIVWLVYALTDSCDTTNMTGEYDAWCDDDSHWTTDQSLIQTYYDNFYVTGMSVTEDHGGKVAVIAQKNVTSGYEQYLWGLADSLEASWLEGQQLNGSRFDAFEIDSHYSAWGIPSGALSFNEVPLATETDLGDLITSENQNTLASAFPSATLGDYANLLYAYEQTSRYTDIGTSSSTTTSSAASLSLTDTELSTSAALRISPFEYAGGGVWETADLASYLEHLSTDLASIFTTSVVSTLVDGATVDASAAQMGVLLLAQSYYLSLYAGLINTVEQDGVSASSDPISSSVLTISSSPAVSVIGAMLDSMQEFFASRGLISTSADGLVSSNMAATLAGARGTILTTFGTIATGATSTYGAALLDLSIYANSVSLSLEDFSINQAVSTAGTTSIAAAVNQAGVSQTTADLGVTAYEQYNTNSKLKKVYKIYKVYKNLKKLELADSLADVISYLAKSTGTIKGVIKLSKSSLAVGILVDVGLFLLTIISSNISVNSLEFTALFARLIATIIVDILFTMLALTGVGLLIVVLIALLDLAVGWICEAAGVKSGSDVDTWVCGGISGVLTNVITYLIFDQTPIPDFSNKNRLDLSMQTPSITQITSNDGFVAGNQINLGFDVTSYLYKNSQGFSFMWDYFWQYDDQYLDDTKIAYQLGATKSEPTPQSVDWQIPSDRTDTRRFVQTFETAGSSTLPAAGINQEVTAYLAESVKSNVQECWAVVITVCYIRFGDLEFTSNIDMSENLVFDVLPVTFDEFYSLASSSNGGYRLVWDDQFPTLVDADGDGLTSAAVRGPDPDDHNPDYDGDGLSDYWEYTNEGYDYANSDSDNDGISDYWETLHGTDAAKPDSDSDGLNDGAEFSHPTAISPFDTSTSSWSGGWSFIYAYSGSTALSTLVGADPLIGDTDSDTISDKLENVYGYNPRVASTLNVLSLNTTLTLPNTASSYVAPGQSIAYTAVITNELDNRYASGLLEGEFPTDTLQDSTSFGTLAPLETTTVGSSVMVPTSINSSQAISMTVRAGTQIKGLNDDRLLWLQFNDDFNDSSMLGHDATCSGSACPTISNNEATFDGADKLTVDYSPDFDTAERTLSIWLNIGNGGDSGWLLYHSILSFVLSINTNNKISLFGPNGACSGNGLITVDSSVLTTNTPHHVAVTYDGSTALLYIDGELNATLAGVPTCFDTNVELNIGDGFKGTMDDVQILTTALSADEVAVLANNPPTESTYELALDFDEAPGQSNFADTSGNDHEVSCSLTAGTCPESGVAGRNNQTLDFDGLNDYLTVEDEANFDFTTEMALAAWVKVDSFTKAHQAIITKGDGAWRLQRSGSTNYVVFATTGLDNVSLVSTIGIADGQWHHIAGIYDGAMKYLYIDGVLNASAIGSATPNSKSISTNNYAVRIGSNAQYTNRTFDGMIDDVYILDTALSPSGVRALMNQSPVMNLHLDEDSGTSFADATENNVDLTCASTTTCPKPGGDGQMREAPLFDGSNKLYNTNISNDLDLSDDFSVSLWVKPTKTKNQNQILLRKSNGSGSAYNYNIWMLSNSMKFKFDLYQASTCTSSGVLHTTSTNALLEDQWNQIAVTYDADGATLKIYLNGSLDKSTSFGGTKAACTTGSVLEIGDAFNGQIDEVAIYDTLLDSDTINDIYEYQVAWYDTAQSFTIQVDADAPVVELSVDDGDFLSADPDKVLTIAASDLTSGIVSVEYQLNSGIWTDATQDGSGAWAFTFTPAGAGNYTINARATDSVGNVGSTSATITVDDNAPTITLDPSLTSTIIRPNGALSLNGSITDDASGINPSSLTIDVQDRNGASVSGAEPHTPYSSDSQVLYAAFNEASGATSFTDSSASDLIGFCTSTPCPTLGSVGKNGTAAAFNGTNNAVTFLGSALDMSGGQFSEAVWIYPSNTDTDFHRIIGYQVGANQYRTPGIWTYQGTKIHTGFGDGTTWKSFTTDSVLTLNAWNHVAITFDGTTYRVYVNGSQVASSSGFAGLTPYPQQGMSIGSVNFQGTIDDVAIYTRALSSSEVAAMADNSASGLGSWQLDYPTTQSLYGIYNVIGSIEDAVGNKTTSTLGTLQLDDRGPNADVLYSSTTISQTNTVLVGTVSDGLYPTSSTLLRFHFDEANSATTFDDGSRNHFTASCTSTTCPSSASGINGNALSFDGGDSLSVSSALTQQLELAQSNFTLGGWIKTTNASQALITKSDGDESWESGEKSFYIDSNGMLTFVGWGNEYIYSTQAVNDGQWHHVAITWEYDTGISGIGTIYVDGSDVTNRATTTYEAVKRDNAADTLYIGRKNYNTEEAPNNFSGIMDEVIAYDSALSADTIYAIANPVATTIASLELRFRHISDRDQTDDAGFWYPVTLDTNDASFSTWSFPLTNLTLEGPYQIDLRATDALGNQSIMPGAWNGQIDTRAPRLTLTASGQDVTCTASDFNLISNWNCSATTNTPTPSYANDDWYVEIFSPIQQLTGLSITATVSSTIGQTLTACDSYGHCTTATLDSTSPGGSSTDLQLWLDASIGTSTNIDGAALTTWTDQSSYGHDAVQATAANQPTYSAAAINGNPAIRFDGNDDYLISSLTLNPQGADITMRAVVQPTLTAYKALVSQQSGSGTGGSTLLYYGADGKVKSTLGLASGSSIVSLSGYTPGTPALEGFSLSAGTTYTLQRNGKADSSFSITAESATGNWIIGADSGFYGRLNAHLAELLVYNDTLDNIQTAQVDSYLALKYGITLDSSTPYRDSSGSVLWDANVMDEFHHDVAGLIRDDASGLNQASARSINSDSIVTLSTSGNLDNQAALLWGNDDGVASNTIIGTTPIAHTRLGRTWRVWESNNVGPVNISFDLSTLGITPNASEVALLIGDTSDFATGSLHISGRSVSGSTVSFSDVDFSSSDYFTLVTANAYTVYVNASDAANYTLVYALDIPTDANYDGVAPTYSVNASASIGSFDRIAYYLELTDSIGTTSWAYASMDAFTSDPIRLGIPTTAGISFEQTVTNLTVESNVAGVTTGSGISTGNIEFWNTNYAKTANSGLGGSGVNYDFDDSPNTSNQAYGSFQVHNYGASQTILAWNRWDQVGIDDIGIGNKSSGNSDWTFAYNADTYPTRTLYVLVRETETTTQSRSSQGQGIASPATSAVSSSIASPITALRSAPTRLPLSTSSLANTGWLNDSCHLLGTDPRLADQQSRIASLNQSQRFYAMWDSSMLSLAWQGADWRSDGDLFLYFDTIPNNGSTQVFNPYSATISTTAVFLPVTGQPPAPMAADYLLWVRNDTMIELYQWDASSSGWVQAMFDGDYNLDGNQRIPLSQIQLPLANIGLTDPGNQHLGLLALATANDALDIWSTMPIYNSLNSARVVGPLVRNDVQTFILSRPFDWPTLDPSVCASGVDNQGIRHPIGPNNTIAANDAYLNADLTADPNGASYELFGNHLIFAQDALYPTAADWHATQVQLCQNLAPGSLPPECVRNADTGRGNDTSLNLQSTLRRIQSIAHPTVRNGQIITYAIPITNHGAKHAEGVTAEVTAARMFVLPNGAPISTPDGQHPYRQIIQVGTIQAGQTITATFTAIVDTTVNPPPVLDWTRLKVAIFDETGDPNRPSEELHMDHEVDIAAPEHAELLAPTTLIGAGLQTLVGMVSDQSPVPTIVLDLGGSQTTCTDLTPADGQWQCTVDLGNHSDGTSIPVQIKAIDQHGHGSDWFSGPSLIVDTTAPTLTLDIPSAAHLADGVFGPAETTLSGVTSDNRQLSHVEVCVDGELVCQPAALTLDPSSVITSTYRYTDEPAEPLAVGQATACGTSNELVRTFNISDIFTIADLDVELRIAHPFRNDVVVHLRSPQGTEIELVSHGAAAANYTVRLDDAASRSIFADDDLSDHPLDSPPLNRRPYADALHMFIGEPAQGIWELRVCDTHPSADDGTYVESMLLFRSETLPEPTHGTWRTTLALPHNVVAMRQQLHIYAYDAAGNRSTALALTPTIDTQAPTLAVTTVSITPSLLLAGTVSDALTSSVRLDIRTPGRQWKTIPLAVTNATWNFSDVSVFKHSGTYCLWIASRDRAANQVTVGPYALQVPYITPYTVYLPLLARASSMTERGSISSGSGNNDGWAFVDPSVCR